MFLDVAVGSNRSAESDFTKFEFEWAWPKIDSTANLIAGAGEEESSQGGLGKETEGKAADSYWEDLREVAAQVVTGCFQPLLAATIWGDWVLEWLLPMLSLIMMQSLALRIQSKIPV